MSNTVVTIPEERLNGRFSKLSRNLLGIGGLALLTTFGFFLKDHHAVFSYLTSFIFFLSITLGALFFVMIQFISRAGWSVVVRRIPELMMTNISLMAVLFVPVLFGLHELYHWTHSDAVAADHVLKGKEPYLNLAFFGVRVLVFFGIWIWLSRKYFKASTEQDASGNPDLTLSMQSRATYGILLFALTVTFAFVDWVMSLTPHWYSTIFGVYMFAGCMVSFFAANSLIVLGLKRYGFLKQVTVEHIHDLGKLMYGFNIFWSYIAFCQYFLIWYSNVPEETVWYANHFVGSWQPISVLLAVGHFFIPFVIFMSRHARRHFKFHAFIALWLLAFQFLDFYWVIMPNASPTGFHLSIVDVTAFIGIGAVYLGVLLRNSDKVSLIPVKDPRLSESLKFHNL